MDSGRKELHHAHLLIGSLVEAEKHLSATLEDIGFILANNPDFFSFRDALFGIEEARKLGMLAARKAVSGRKIFFLAPERLTHEAQNALLKTFEDPYPDTHFFLVAREEARILPTLRSRMLSLHLAAAPETKDAESFLSMSIKERLSFAGKFVEKEGNISAFLNDLLLALRRKNVGIEKEGVVHRIATAAGEATPAAKMVLEHLALVL